MSKKKQESVSQVVDLCKAKIENFKKELGIVSTTVEKLNNVGIKYLIHLTLLNPEEISDICDIDVEVAKRIVRKARNILNLHIKPITWSEKVKIIESLPVIPTHVNEFDKLFPYHGLKISFSYEFAGEFGTGKSLLAHQVAVSGIKHLNCKVIYIDTENSFNPNILAKLAKRFQVDENLIYESIYSLQFKTVEELEQFVKTELLNFIIENNVKIIIIDSITELYRAQFAGRDKLAERQQRLHYIVDLLRRFQVEFKILTFFTNQVMDIPIGFIELKKPVGGNVLAHTVNYRFMMHRPSKQKPEGHITPLDVPGMSPDIKIKYEIRDDGLY